MSKIKDSAKQAEERQLSREDFIRDLSATPVVEEYRDIVVSSIEEHPGGKAYRLKLDTLNTLKANPDLKENERYMWIYNEGKCFYAYIPLKFASEDKRLWSKDHSVALLAVPKSMLFKWIEKQYDFLNQ